MGATRVGRRPKAIRYPLRKTLRFDEEFDNVVTAMRQALAKSRGVDVDSVDFSEAVRILTTDRFKAARLLADDPASWPTSKTVELPDKFWDALTDYQNKLSHVQGSLYNVSRKLNFGQVVTKDEVREAFEALTESKRMIVQLEKHALLFESNEAAAKSDGQGA